MKQLSDTMTLEEYRTLMGIGDITSKYKNKKTRIDKIKFDSLKEGNRYSELKILQKAGEVSHFNRQVIYDLGEGIVYKLDFMVFWADGRITHEDVKGFKTDVYRIKKKLVEGKYPIKIEEI